MERCKVNGVACEAAACPNEGREGWRALDGGFEVPLPLAPVLAVVAGPVADVPWTLRAFDEGDKAKTSRAVLAMQRAQLVLW